MDFCPNVATFPLFHQWYVSPTITEVIYCQQYSGVVEILVCRVYSVNCYTGVVVLTDPAAVMQFNWHGRGVKLRKYALLTCDIPLISSLILIGLFLQIPKI